MGRIQAGTLCRRGSWEPQFLEASAEEAGRMPRSGEAKVDQAVQRGCCVLKLGSEVPSTRFPSLFSISQTMRTLVPLPYKGPLSLLPRSLSRIDRNPFKHQWTQRAVGTDYRLHIGTFLLRYFLLEK